MSADSVTIIVRAANQQFDDQTVQCYVDWTIHRLKNYLSEVYPNKPRIEDQRLIYSGKLLKDNTVLKDILRVYEGQENHTFHLVCKTAYSEEIKATSSSFSSNGTVPSNSGHGDVNEPNASNSFFNMYAGPNSYIMNGNGINSSWAYRPSVVTNGDITGDLQEQLSMMQQAYAQYISYYIQSFGYANAFGYSAMPFPQFSASGPANTITSQPFGPASNEPGNDAQNDAAVDARLQAAAIGGNAVAAQNRARDPLEEEEGNGDVLDWLYSFSKAMILLSIIYFYSSPARFLCVLTFTLLVYLYQRGFFGQIGLNHGINNNNNVNYNNQNAGNNGNANLPAAPEVQNAATAENQMEATPAQEDGAALSPDAATDAPTPQNDNRRSPVHFTWIVVRTFFLSLIPEPTPA